LEHPPDVAVVDIQILGWNGLTTLKAFRIQPVLSGVRMMMLTSDASKDTMLQAIRLGADDYLLKSRFCKEEFYRKLEKLLSWSPANH